MVPIGACIIIFLVKMQQLELVRQGLNTTINIKLSFKFGKEIWNLSPKIFRWVGHLWTRLLLVRTRQTQRYHFCTRLLLVQNPIPQNTNTTNVIVKTQRKSAKRVRIRGSGVRPKFVRLKIKRILFVWWQQIKKIKKQTMLYKERTLEMHKTGIVRLIVKWLWFVWGNWL